MIESENGGAHAKGLAIVEAAKVRGEIGILADTDMGWTRVRPTNSFTKDLIGSLEREGLTPIDIAGIMEGFFGQASNVPGRSVENSEPVKSRLVESYSDEGHPAEGKRPMPRAEWARKTFTFILMS